MARLARIVVPGVAHHVIQRGVRRMDVFRESADYECYLSLLAESSIKAGTDVWAYCLMINHVHLILVPGSEDGLRGALGEAHRRYTSYVNFREGCRGHLWQERFHSYAMDERHLLAAVRYVEMNPVRAGTVGRAEEYPWSSARAHLSGRSDGLVKVRAMLDRVGDWSAYLASEVDESLIESLE